MNTPKISVIIPMYNAEKFIRECLVSVLASTFQNYELLVVDDCSTDNSLAEVKKLLPHFDGRLKILSTEKNSGGPGLPRNIGIKNASGKYITFIDNDDMILPNTLEIFFTTAETYGADVIHTEKCLVFEGEFQRSALKNCRLGNPEKFVSEPTFEPLDLNYRVNYLMHERDCWMPWGKFYRREFLLENKIEFPPNIQFGEDVVFIFKCLCLAEKYLRVPYMTNIHRVSKISGANVCFDDIREGIRFLLNIFLTELAVLDEFMNGLEFFRANPARYRDVIKFLVEVLNFPLIKSFPKNRPPHEIQKIFFDVLENSNLNSTGKNVLVAYLCTEKLLAL